MCSSPWGAVPPSPGHLPTPCSDTARRAWAGHSSQPEPCSFLPFSLPLAPAPVPGNSLQGWSFPYNVLEVNAKDLDTYWDFEDFLGSAVSEQEDAFVFSWPIQEGLQPQGLLPGGLWVSGRPRLLSPDRGPSSRGLGSFSSLIPVSCSG